MLLKCGCCENHGTKVISLKIKGEDEDNEPMYTRSMLTSNGDRRPTVCWTVGVSENQSQYCTINSMANKTLTAVTIAIKIMDTCLTLSRDPVVMGKHRNTSEADPSGCHSLEYDNACERLRSAGFVPCLSRAALPC